MDRAGLLYVLDRKRLKLVALPAGGSGNEPPPSNEPGTDPGGEPGGGNPGGSPGSDPGGDPGGGDKTFTQEEVNRMMAREKSQGRDAAMRELSETLGVTVDEAKEIVQTHQQREEEQMSEAEKAKAAAERERQEAEAEKAKAARERHDLKVERHIGTIDPNDAEANTSKVTKVARMLDLEVGASDEEVKAAVDDLRTEFPALFEVKADEGGGRRTPPSDPGPSPRRKPPAEDAMSRGAERAKNYQGADGVQYETSFK